MKDEERRLFYAAVAAQESSCRFAIGELDAVLANPPAMLAASPMRMMLLRKRRGEVAAKQAMCAAVPHLPLASKWIWD
jgi:hypothetical protein